MLPMLWRALKNISQTLKPYKLLVKYNISSTLSKNQNWNKEKSISDYASIEFIFPKFYSELRGPEDVVLDLIMRRVQFGVPVVKFEELCSTVDES